MLEKQIQTPALVLDMDIFEKNLKKAVAKCEAAGVSLRPHFKSAKCTAIARLELEAGGKGLCCAKVSEAEVLVESGFEDILIANQVVDRSKISKAAALATCCRLSVCVDNEDNIRSLEKQAEFQGSVIYCLVEYDVGMNRCGVKTPEGALKLAVLINECRHLRFDGIQAYAGNIAHCEDFDTRKQISEETEKRIASLKDFLKENGVKVPKVTGVSTGTLQFRKPGTIYDEVQCGSFIYCDAAYKAVGVNFDSSLTVLGTVMNVMDDHITIDTGVKSVSMDQRTPFFMEFPELPIDFSEEHSTLPTTSGYVGQRLHMVPSHCCTTINMYDWLYLVRHGRVEGRIPVDGRGKSI